LWLSRLVQAGDLPDVKAGLLWNRLRRECRLYRANRPLGRWFGEWRRAPAAESEADWIFGAAFRATLRHRSGALATESHPLRIVEAAGVAAHVSRPLMKLDVYPYGWQTQMNT
jgi:hypothetical protein